MGRIKGKYIPGRRDAGAGHEWTGKYDAWLPAKDHAAMEFVGHPPMIDLEIKLIQCACGVTKIMLRSASSGSGLPAMTTYVYKQQASSKLPPCLLELDGID